MEKHSYKRLIVTSRLTAVSWSEAKFTLFGASWQLHHTCVLGSRPVLAAVAFLLLPAQGFINGPCNQVRICGGGKGSW